MSNPRLIRGWTANEDDIILVANDDGGSSVSDAARRLAPLLAGRSELSVYHRLRKLRRYPEKRVVRREAAAPGEPAAVVDSGHSKPGWGGERRTRRRACLRCDRNFNSVGPHNRMCDRCRNRGAELSPFAP